MATDRTLLTQIATDISWMKSKQIKHDETLEKIWDKLEEGTGKINENKTKINGLIKILCILFPVLIGILAYLFTMK